MKREHRHLSGVLVVLFSAIFLVSAVLSSFGEADGLLPGTGLGLRAPPEEAVRFTLPASLAVIEESAFEETAAERVQLPEGMLLIGERAFADVATLREVAIPLSVTNIGDTAFDGAAELVLTGTPGSYAQQWASEHGVSFMAAPCCATEANPFFSVILALGVLFLLFGRFQPEQDRKPVFRRVVEQVWINDPDKRTGLRVLSLDFP